MQIAVITVQREPMYLYDTLESLIASVPWGTRRGGQRWIDVFVGTPNYSEIAERVFPIARAHEIPGDLWNLIEPLPPKLRAVGNFINALRSGDDDLVLFEDDIKVKPGWLQALEIADVVWNESEIDFNPKQCFISLYSHRDLRRASAWRLGSDAWRFGPDAALLRKPIVDFYGTLGLFVPGKHRRPLAEAALIHLQPNDPRPVEQRWPFDEIVKMYVNDHRECSLAVTIPSYVDHVGDVSLINPTHGIRRAPMF